MKENFKNLFLQFTRDLHRLQLILDGKLMKDYKKVIEYLFENLEINEAKHCIYFLTQNSLSEFFINEHQKIEKDSFLFCEPEYIVKICTKKKIISIKKQFRNVCVMDVTDEFLLDITNLHIFYYLKEKINTYFWEYDLKKEKSTPVVVEFKNITFE